MSHDYYVRALFRPPEPEFSEEMHQRNVAAVMNACGIQVETITEGMD